MKKTLSIVWYFSQNCRNFWYCQLAKTRRNLKLCFIKLAPCMTCLGRWLDSCKLCWQRSVIMVNFPRVFVLCILRLFWENAPHCFLNFLSLSMCDFIVSYNSVFILESDQERWNHGGQGGGSIPPPPHNFGFAKNWVGNFSYCPPASYTLAVSSCKTSHWNFYTETFICYHSGNVWK